MVTGPLGTLASLAALRLAAGLVEATATVATPAGTPAACPGAAAVEARLLPLLPPPEQRAPRLARISRRGAALLVELLDPSGRLLASRELPATAPCDDLAAAAAVVLGASWQASPPPELPPLSLEPTPVLRRPAPQRRPFELAASAFVSFAGAGGDVAPGGLVETSLAPRGRRLGARLFLLGAGARETALGPGRAAWTRLALGAGPRYGLDKGRFFLALHAEGLLALTLVRGEGFPESLQSAAADLGLGGGLRVGVRVGPLSPFLGGAVIGWLRPQRLEVAGLLASAELPRYEILLTGGVALGRFP